MVNGYAMANLLHRRVCERRIGAKKFLLEWKPGNRRDDPNIGVVFFQIGAQTIFNEYAMSRRRRIWKQR